MNAERTFVHGASIGCRSKAELAKQLADQDWQTEDEASIEGTAASAEVLHRDVNLVSNALTAAGIRHWLEISDGQQNSIRYIHNGWPDSEV